MGFIKTFFCKHKKRTTINICKAHYPDGEIALHRKKVKCKKCGKVFIENILEGKNEKVTTGLKK